MNQCVESPETAAGSRADMYKFLADVFLKPPTTELLNLISDGSFLDDLGSSFDDTSMAPLREFAENYSGQIDETVQEFNNLFKVPLGQYVTPYESVYQDKGKRADGKVKGLLMGESTIAVQSFYKEAGLAIDYAEYRDLPDHIGAELGFMRHLCEKERDTRQSGNTELARGYAKVQNLFLDGHLKKWVPQLAENIAKKAKSLFYKGIANLLRDFIANDSGTPGGSE